MTKRVNRPKRVQRIIDKARSGYTLCKTFPIAGTNETKPFFYWEPGGVVAPTKSCLDAIASGELLANRDGLFGPETSQSWSA